MTQTISLITSSTGQPILSERTTTDSGVVPGMLVVESSGSVIKNVTADSVGPKLFAQKNNIIAGDIDTVYTVGDTVSYGAYHAGQQVNALLAAGAAAIVDGAPLTSAGDGTLKVGTDANAIAYAIEAVDNSGGGSTVRIHARIA
jgi:hypothetical protein